MKELPKELTQELLSLVLGRDSVSEIHGIQNNKLCFVLHKDNRFWYDYINIDTLTRLMKEKLKEFEIIFTIYYHLDTVSISINQSDIKYSTPPMTVYTDFESTLKALHTVAKEKGLL